MINLFITVVIGIVIFVFSQFILILFIEPIREYKKIVSIILSNIEFYKPMIFEGTIDNYVILFELFRKTSADLNAAYGAIPFKKIFIFLGIIIEGRNVFDVCSSLRFLSTCTYGGDKEELLYRKEHVYNIESKLKNE